MTKSSNRRSAAGWFPPGAAYQFQYTLTWRLLLRLEGRTLPDFSAAVNAAPDYEVDVRCFFVMCWQILDWVKNDHGIARSVSSAVERAAKASPILKLCHDLGNGAKHYTLESPKRDAPGVGLGALELVRREDSDESTLRYLVVFEDDTTRCADELAREALQAWAKILDANGLQRPQVP